MQNYGQEAVDICKENSEIDFILMDLKMPIMNGFEATLNEIDMNKKKSEKKIIINKENTPMDIPLEGSLGLLALGAVGIIEWRKVRDAQKEETKKQLK